MEGPRKTGQPDRRANRLILRRTLVLMVMFGVVSFGVLLWKLWQIQIVNHEFYEEKAIEQQTRDVTVSANRGTIYDSDGNILAISATVQNVILSPRDVLANAMDKNLIADGLSEILGIDREKIMKRLEKTNSAWELVASKVEEDTAAKVRQFILDNKLSSGLYLTPDTKRYYPYSSLASQVIGFVNSENNGAYGLEAIYENDLAGQSGRVITAKNASGAEMLSNYENYIDAVDGYDLHLTLNATIQYYAERILQEGIKTFEVRNGGFCIVMNPSTGAIYAMASYPDYDLNDPRAITDESLAAQLAGMKDNPNVSEEDYLKALGDAQFEQWRSKAVNDTYEPGSTFKSLVLAAALEEGAVNEGSTFYCTGSVQVGGFTIKCHKRDGHGSENLRQAVMNSCNPAFIAIGQKLGAEKFYQYLEDYGLKSTTGIDMQGEGKGYIWDRDFFLSKEGITSLATASFGQRLNVTPIQLITAAASVINGGHLMEPYVLQSVTDESGSTVSYHDPVEVRKVISETTSETVRSILESVVGDGGTGKNAYVAGYRIGGKTGTSETLVDDEFIVSFLGFAPADNPQIIVLLGYDSPTPNSPGSNYTAGGYYISGGNMAAPMAGRLIADILDYMGVEKQYTQEELSGADTLVPKVTGVPLEEAQRLLKNSGLAWRVVGEGSSVTDQLPAQGASIPKNSQVVLYLGAEKPTESATVPDVTGHSPKDALAMLQEAGLYLRASGAVKYYTADTIAANQSIEAGTQVEQGTVIEVGFIDNQVRDYAGN